MSFYKKLSCEDDIKNKKFLTECKKITYYIFEGYTTHQIAKTLSYSRSTVSARIQYLLNEYKVKNKIQFIVRILGDMLKEHKLHLNYCKFELKRLGREVFFIKSQIRKILQSDNMKNETKLKEIKSILNQTF